MGGFCVKERDKYEVGVSVIMGRKKNDDLGAAIGLIIAALVFVYVYWSSIVAWIKMKVAEFVNGLIAASWAFVVGLIELGVPLVIGWYVGEYLIEEQHWEDWIVAGLGIVIGIVVPWFVYGYLALLSFVGWGMGLNVFLRFLGSQNWSL